MSEHLYRDEVGAAVERLAQLEDENARLREELARLDAPKKAAASSRLTAALMVFFAGVLSLAALGVGHGCPQRGAAAKRARLVASQRTKTTPDARSRAVGFEPTEFRVIQDGDDCATPYYYDANGVKHYRASCLAFGVRGGRF